MIALINIIVRYSLDDSLIGHRAGNHSFIVDWVNEYFTILYMTFCRRFVLMISPT